MICNIFLFFTFISFTSFVSPDFINLDEALTRHTCEPKNGTCSPCTFLKDCPVDQLSFMTTELCKVACKGIAKGKEAAEDEKTNRTRRGAPMAMNTTDSVNKTETQLPKPGRERRAAAPPKAKATNATEMGNLTSEGKDRTRRDVLNAANMTSNATDHKLKPQVGKIVKRETRKISFRVAKKDNSTMDSMANQTMPVGPKVKRAAGLKPLKPLHANETMANQTMPVGAKVKRAAAVKPLKPLHANETMVNQSTPVGPKVKRAAGLKPLHANETMTNSTEEPGHGRVARSAAISIDRPVVNLDKAVLYMENLTIVASKDGESVGNDTTVLEMKDPEITINEPVVNLQKAILHIKDLKIISSTGSLDKDQEPEAPHDRPARRACR